MSLEERSRFQVLEVLDAHALLELEARCAPLLCKLHERYLPEIPADHGYLPNADYLDGLRIAWLLDKRWFKPSRRTTSQAFGYAFGRLLSENLGMKWCRIKDGYGEALSMVYFNPSEDSSQYQNISLPPFNFMEKRERTLNGDVFRDGVSLAERMIGGGVPN